MLDVSIRLGVLNLLAGLTTERQLALLYITPDIASAPTRTAGSGRPARADGEPPARSGRRPRCLGWPAE